MNNVLTYMTFIPVAGAAIVLALPNNAKLIRWVSAVATMPPLLLELSAVLPPKAKVKPVKEAKVETAKAENQEKRGLFGHIRSFFATVFR
jgi:NADH:ubiquinone oxidoreductase subunit 4 (subunit M)